MPIHCDSFQWLNIGIAWTCHFLQCQFYIFIRHFPHHCGNETLHSSVSVVMFALPRKQERAITPFFFFNIFVVGAKTDKKALSFQQNRGQGFAIRLLSHSHIFYPLGHSSLAAWLGVLWHWETRFIILSAQLKFAVSSAHRI